MTKQEIKDMVRQIIGSMANDYGIANEDAGVGNVTANVAGYDAPLASPVRRKTKRNKLFNLNKEDM